MSAHQVYPALSMAAQIMNGLDAGVTAAVAMYILHHEQ
jgi:hypothetical protein